MICTTYMKQYIACGRQRTVQSKQAPSRLAPQRLNYPMPCPVIEHPFMRTDSPFLVQSSGRASRSKLDRDRGEPSQALPCIVVDATRPTVKWIQGTTTEKRKPSYTDVHPSSCFFFSSQHMAPITTVVVTGPDRKAPHRGSDESEEKRDSVLEPEAARGGPAPWQPKLHLGHLPQRQEKR